MNGFGDQLNAFAKKTSIRFDRVVRKVSLDLMRDLVMLTPVDTGMARSNWFTASTRLRDTETTASKNGGPSLGRASRFAATLQAGGVFYITNNLPYIMALEYGHSGQAPAGMARVTVARWQGIVNSVVRSL